MRPKTKIFKIATEQKGPSIKDVYTPWGDGAGQKCTIYRQGGGFTYYVRTHFSRRLFTEVTTYDKKVCKYL